MATDTLPQNKDDRFNKSTPIDRLRAQIPHGLARGNQYQVYIMMPKLLASGMVAAVINLSTPSISYKNNIQHTNSKVMAFDTSRIMERLSFTCEAAALPGRGVAVKDVKTYGPVRKYAWDQSYSELALTFMVGHDMFEKKLFEAWQQSIFDPLTNNINYYDDYISPSIDILQKDGAEVNTYGIRILDAYPSIIGDLALGYAETDNYHKLSVTMTYRKWVELKVAEPAGEPIVRPTVAEDIE